ncbi:hypothetical protein HFN80_32685 [Rhizobium laguerreae]|uniref:hypothetical protein n=1 Tax=Rhizobium laguerreae TaxID=1076926 RepID=UPI001C90B741|nr:hypothetical protein [Rhizobium laguerreae]MBY3468682.1 hypothetical protein [Rhizobium laguerreae]
MISGRGNNRMGFKCEAIVNRVAWREARAGLDALVRTYGELPAVYSFMHLAFKEKGMRLVVGELADRAADIRRTIVAARSVMPAFVAEHHAFMHLGKADRLLADADKLLQRGVLVVDAPLLGLLSTAAIELKKSAAILGTTTFDTSNCCARSLFDHGEENHGSAFDLGA